MLMTLWTLAEEGVKSLSSGFILCFTAESDKEIEGIKVELEALRKQLDTLSPVCQFVKNKSEARYGLFNPHELDI